MGDEQSHDEIFDKIDKLLDDVDITATTRVIKSTTKAPTFKDAGNCDLLL